MPELCRHCGAEVNYECNGSSRCKACGEKLYGIVLPPHDKTEMMKRIGD